MKKIYILIGPKSTLNYFDWTKMKLLIFLCCLVVFVFSTAVSSKSGSNYMGRIGGSKKGYYCTACSGKIIKLDHYSGNRRIRKLLCNKYHYKKKCPCSSLVFVLFFFKKSSGLSHKPKLQNLLKKTIYLACQAGKSCRRRGGCKRVFEEDEALQEAEFLE
jgi:hypothetical protein